MLQLFRFLLLIVSSAYCRQHSSSIPPNSSQETMLDYLDAQRRLLNYVFHEKDYHKSIPAVYGRARNEPIERNMTKTVDVTLMYGKILDLKEPEQTIRVISEVMIVWKDERLRWNPGNFNQIEHLLVPREKLWLPDVVTYDISDYLEPLIPDLQSVVVYSNGSCYWYVSAVVTFICELNMTDFPFDSQECSIKYTAYTSVKEEMLLAGSVSTELEKRIHIMGNNAWAVTGITVRNRWFFDPTRGWNYSELNFLFKIRRSDGYYVVLIIIPSFVLTFLCMAGLFWAPISFDTYMDKLNLAYAAILAMVLVLQITTDNIPKTMNIPILSIYSIINLFLITIASLTVLVIGKYLASHKDTKWNTRWRRFLRNYVHLVCLVLFLLATGINLVVLLLSKKEDVPGFVDIDEL